MKEPKDLESAFEEVCQEMEEIFVKKYKDYGKGNILDTKELGIAFRISDKLNRLKHLLSNGKNPDNESLDDSWIDIAVYAVIAMMYRRQWFQKLELRKKRTRI
ncbi:MAG: nucleotide modification associated domain-containing protein [Patescibacteria group bacterium]